jgi:multiple sugar transport system permease protein
VSATTTAVRPPTSATTDEPRAPRKRPSNIGTYLFLTVMAILWLIPLLWTLYTAIRPHDATNKYGYFSLGGGVTFDNFSTAWNSGFATYLTNSAIITIPAVIITLFLASCVAFAVSRFNWRFNIAVLIVFTAGNLLPPQILATPIYQLFKNIPLPPSVSDSGSLLNTYFAVILMNVAFQVGFCTFVLSNYMKALPAELGEAALVDGASVWRQYRSVILPLCRPALGALATLEVIWIYNDFFWALLLIQTGNRLPITTAINNLKGEFVDNYNLIAAGAMITVIPTLIIYFVLQRQFVAGLTLGASKG